MRSCAFFGHRRFSEEYSKDIEDAVIDLIENHEVAQFYNGYRGNFDKICAYIVWNLRSKYRHIKNTMVLSYIPTKSKNFFLPQCFDNSVYLIDKNIPLRFAISYTNKKIVDISDFIISGITTSYGGALEACKYAKSKGKIIINICDTV